MTVPDLIAGMLREEGGFQKALRDILDDELRMSLNEFCQISGISQSTMYKLLEDKREPNLRTVRQVIKALKVRKNLTVITNSSEIVCELCDKPFWRVFATGGMLKEGGYAFVGARAVEAIKSFHVDYAIFSCKGIDMKNGLTDSNDDDAEIKKAIIGSARTKLLAIDSTKFNRVSLVEICKVGDVDIVVTDKNPGIEWTEFFAERQIGLLYPVRNA